LRVPRAGTRVQAKRAACPHAPLSGVHRHATHVDTVCRASVWEKGKWGVKGELRIKLAASWVRRLHWKEERESWVSGVSHSGEGRKECELNHRVSLASLTIEAHARTLASLREHNPQRAARRRARCRCVMVAVANAVLCAVCSV
jgi:hypothetical protein